MGQKIVHVVNDFPTKSETFITNHIVETIKQGYQSHILVNNLTPKTTASQKKLFDTYKLYELSESFNPIIPKNKLLRLLKAIVVLFKNLKFAPVFIRTLNTKRYGKKSRSLKMWFQASTFIKFRNVQLFHGHFAKCGQILIEMKQIGAIKGRIFTTFYGYDTFSTLENREALKSEYSELFENTDKVITSSNYLLNNLLQLDAPQHKIVVNPVGLDIKRFKYKERTLGSTFQIITVGRLIKLKGQHLGIKAVKNLIDKGIDIHYTIVGAGEEFNNLKTLINQLDLQNYVSLKLSKTQEEVMGLLYQSHLFLMTSITDETGRAEGQGLVTAEALSTGIPVIGFNSGGVPETIQHDVSGYIIEENNVEELTNTIEKFINQPSLVSKMGKAGRKFIEKEFNSEIQSNKIISLYNKLH